MLKICLTANAAWNIANFRLNHATAVRQAGVEVHAVAPPDDSVASIESAGLIFHPWIVDRRSLNPFQDLVSLNRLRGIYADIQPSLVHHYTVKALLYGTLAARLARVPAVVNAITGLPYIVVSEKSSVPKRLACHAAMHWYGWSLRGRGVAVIAQNHDDLDFLERYAGGIRVRATVTAGSGVDLQHFHTAPLPQNTPLRLLFVGRLLREKGIYELVDAMRLLRRAGHEVRLTLCGKTDPGNRSSATEEECHQWEQEGLVEIVGYQDDVRPLLGASDIVVLPSWREGTPRSLLEALATGRPIIATDVPGCREVVEHDVNGLLVPSQDADQLAEAISELLNDPDRRQAMASASRGRAETIFDERRVIAQTLGVYKCLVPDWPETGGEPWDADGEDLTASIAVDRK